jgi:hypothetical protein
MWNGFIHASSLLLTVVVFAPLSCSDGDRSDGPAGVDAGGDAARSDGGGGSGGGRVDDAAKAGRGGLDAEASDTGDADSGTSSASLTATERAAIESQILYELEQMGLLASTAKDSAIEHTVVIRLPFPWGFFTNDMLCVVDSVNPEGCRSGTSRFDPGLAFATIEPSATYAYEWAGDVGSFAGTLEFELSGTPVYFLDTNAFEPNDDALIEIRGHTELVEVTEEAAGTLLLERQAEKDFDIIREGEPVRMHHTDLTTLTAEPLPAIGGVDVLSLSYQATFDALRSEPISVSVDVDGGGNVSGTITAGSLTLATIAGAPFAEPPDPLTVDWTGEPAIHDGTGCTPACGERVCGREPSCGTECGACDAGERCGPLGTCSTAP